MHIIINKKYLTYNNYKVKCSIGKRGIGRKTKEGDLITPKGEYTIKYILYRKDRVKKIQTKIKTIVIRNNMGWCDDPKSKNYNQLIKLPSAFRHEKLFKKKNIYDIILVLNYNMNPVVKKKGSAIFIHVVKGNYKKTKGCIALKKIHLLKILKILKKNTKVKIENRR